MKTLLATVLLALLVATTVSGIILYKNNRDVKENLLVSEKKVVELEQANAKNDQKISQLMDSLGTLQNELDEERKIRGSSEAELSSKDARIKEFQDQVQGLQSQIRKLDDEIAEGHTTIETLRAEITALKEQNAAQKEEMAQMQSTYEDTTRKLQEDQEEARKAAEALNQEISSKEVYLAELKEKYEETQSHIGELNQVVTGKEETIRSLKTDLLEKGEVIEKLEMNLTSRNALVTQLEGQVQGLQSHARELNDEIAEGHTTIETLRAEMTALKDQNRAQKEEMAQMQSTYEGTTRKLQEDLEEARKAAETLNQEISSKEVSLVELKEKYEEAQSRISSFEGELAETRKNLTGRLTTLRGEKALAETEIDLLKSTYEALVNDFKEQIENQEVTLKRFKEEISITFVDRILFEFGKATIAPEAKDILQSVGGILKTVEDRKITVIGHTDNKPIHPDYRYKFPSNWELSSARASAVVRYFQETIGLNPESLEAVGRAFYDPIASNDTAEGRAQNRRVEIIIAPEIQEINIR